MTTSQRILLLTLAPLAVMTTAGGACPTGPVSYCEAQVRAECRFLFNCCKDDELVYQYARAAYAANEGECFDRMAPSCKTSSGGLDRSIGLGRLQFNGDKASTCANAAMAAADACDPSLAYVIECSQVTLGLVKDGDDCAFSAECGNGGSCDGIDDNVNEELGAVEGECTAPQPEGEDCSEKPCEDGLACTSDGSGDPTCEVPAGDGDDCASASCGFGLFCNADEECEVRRDDGDDCDDANECKTFTCTDGACGTDTCNGR